MAEITYTPDGQPRAPGFYNPSNPWDTGYSGNKNSEVAARNGYQPGKMEGWNYDNGTPMANYNPDQYGGPGGAAGTDLTSSPYYQQMLSLVNAQGAAESSSTRAAIQQALIAFGLVPDSFKDKFGALDDVTKSLIQKNTDTGISGYARLLEGRSDNIKNLVRGLSARGMRRSGSKGYGLRRNQTGFDRAFADALGGVMGGISGMYSNYAQNEFGRQMSLAQILATLAGGYRGPGGGSPGPSAPPPPSDAADPSGWTNDSYPITNPIGGKPTYF